MASKNEKRAAELGISLKKYKDSDEYKKKKNDDSEKKAKEKTKDYYEMKEEREKKQAELDKKRLKEDFDQIMQDLGLSENRAIQDYSKNLEILAEDKQTGLEDLDYYVETQSGRLEEDLDTALSRESRRYELEQDQTRRSLAARGLTFGGVRESTEGLLTEKSEQITGDLQTQASRSFQDIARQEYEKNRDFEEAYSRGVDVATLEKERTLEDLDYKREYAQSAYERGIEDVKIGKSTSLEDLEYDRDSALSGIEQDFKSYYQNQKQEEEKFNLG